MLPVHVLSGCARTCVEDSEKRPAPLLAAHLSMQVVGEALLLNSPSPRALLDTRKVNLANPPTVYSPFALNNTGDTFFHKYQRLLDLASKMPLIDQIVVNSAPAFFLLKHSRFFFFPI